MTRDRRRFNRLQISIPVLLRRGNREERLVTGDISRHGAFILTDHPLRERELVQLRFHPEGENPLDAMCMVARSLGPGDPGGPGMGVDFFALSRDMKDRWDHWVLAVQRAHEEQAQGAPSEPPKPLAASVEDLDAIFDEAAAAMPAVVGNTLEGDAEIEAPIRRRYPRERACFLVRMKDEQAVNEFLTRDVSRGGMFLETPVQSNIGDTVMLVLVHPSSGEEFDVKGTVARVDLEGMGIRFEGLSGRRKLELEDFFTTGVKVLEARDMPELERLHAAEAEVHELPDEPDVLEALGRERLKNGDLAGAIEALTSAVLLAPSMVSLHEKLAAAYYEVGDAARGRGHERVALSLSLYKVDVENAL